MAHTERRPEDTRLNPGDLPDGTRIGLQTPNGVAYGVISRHDQGGWIYVTWETNFTPLPWFLRPTQVFRADKTTADKVINAG